MAMSLVDDEEAAPETPTARVTRAEAAFREIVRCGGSINLRDYTPEETDTHKRNCELGKLNKCGRCRYLDLMAKEHRRFTMLRFVAPQLAFKSPKQELLAKLPWLAIKRDPLNGGAYYGCVACHAYARERPERVF